MYRLNPSIALLLLILTSLFVYPACVNQEVRMRSDLQDDLKIYTEEEVYNFSPLGSRFNMDPPLTGDLGAAVEEGSGAVYDPFAKYSAQTYHGADGSITRHYYFQTGRGEVIASLLQGQVGGLTLSPSINAANPAEMADETKTTNLADNEIKVLKDVIRDTRPSKAPGMLGLAQYNTATGNVSDLMLVKTKDPEKLMEIDSFLTNLLTELPQIEVKVRVVEVAVTDEWQWGNENVINYLTSSSKAFFKEWFNFYNTPSLIKAGGADDFQGTLFNALGVHDKLELDATFELLQRVTDSDILSAPTLTVQHGHRAIIETGDRVPIQKVVANASSAYLAYDYQQTGIKLVIVPYLLPNDMIEIHLNVEIVAVTGRETFDTTIGTLTQPILSQRMASTRLQLKEGQAFALGGLMATTEFEIVSKLPILGDIPVLGYLFKMKSVEKRQSQIIFYVEPSIVRRDRGWEKTTEE